MVFKKINTIFFKKKQVFSIFFVYCPESLLKVCAQNPAKASGESAARQVKACYCFQNAAEAYGKGAARHLKAGYCLTSLSEATRKVLGKRPESFNMQQKLW